MYEQYYGFSEKPFSLTPDPKYLYRSQSHANAFDLLQYAIRRREGFVVVTGDIGTGKTTLCRALLEQIDRTTFTALVLNPFMTEEDLLRRILQDFGVISREEVKAGRLAGISKQELIDTLYDFLLGLIPLKASAVLIIDEAQNLPLRVLEQIRILSNLETDKEKLLQIILVGQLNLQTLLRSPELRQLDQRVSIRYELKPLAPDAVSAYVAHRLTVAGGAQAVGFAPKAMKRVHRLSGGIPRLINLICDRALLAGYSVRASMITRDMVSYAAESLDVQTPGVRRFAWLRPRPSLLAAALVVLVASAIAVGATALIYERFVGGTVEAAVRVASEQVPEPKRPASRLVSLDLAREMPREATATILVGSFNVSGADAAAADRQIRALTGRVELAGFHVYYADVDRGAEGRWRRVLAGAYTDPVAARADAAELSHSLPEAEPRVMAAAVASEPQS